MVKNELTWTPSAIFHANRNRIQSNWLKDLRVYIRDLIDNEMMLKIMLSIWQVLVSKCFKRTMI